MKIVSGEFGGRRLNVPKGRDIRPTSDKIRGAVFNMLCSRGAVDDAFVLDAFCGTGALGLEALSRGAAQATFFDKSRDSLHLAKSNAEMLGAENTSFKIVDSTKLSSGSNGFNLVFLDPPYNKGIIAQSLERLINGGWLAPGAWILCESERSYHCALPDGVVLNHEKIYGDTKIFLLQYQPITPV
jgi:16S rRNA (guanine966-N2)-methyltransferase